MRNYYYPVTLSWDLQSHLIISALLEYYPSLTLYDQDATDAFSYRRIRPIGLRSGFGGTQFLRRR